MTRFRQPPFSVIIPTLWRPSTFINLLESLQSSDHVKEVIVIDNAKSFRPSLPELNKVKLIERGANLFVNPSWNLGITLASSDSICICNDDILLAENLLNFIRKNHIKGIIGLHPESYKTPLDQAQQPTFSTEVHITKNWGSLLFFERNNYVPIPESMKIWWGDAWLAQEMKPARSIKSAVSTPHSVSAGSAEFKEITREDTRLWNEKFKRPPSNSERFKKTVRTVLRKLNYL